MRIPIRYQFMLPLLAVALVSLFAIGVINARLATRQTKARIERQLQGVVTVLAESSYPLTDSVLRQMGGLANAEFILTDGDGNTLASGTTVGLDGLAANSLTAKTAADVRLGSTQVLGSIPYLHSSVWVPRRPPFADPSVLHILFAQQEFDAAWRAAFLPPVFVGLFTITVIGLLIHLLAGRVSKVLSHLGQEVERLADGDFSEVHQPEWNDETRDLAAAVNQTAVRLADYEREMRRTERLRTVAMLGAGLAHEMRNAATGCRLAVDLHSENCHGDPADESLDVARRQLVLMEGRLQQLLHLGNQSSETNGECADLSVGDLAELVSESIALIKPAAAHAGVTLDWQVPDHKVSIQANTELLGQAVMNVLLNAIDAASKRPLVGNRKGLVRVEMIRLDNESELVVADSGEGPDQGLPDNLFEPFVTSKPEGVGLGLAVAKRIVESYDGHITWARDAGITKFSIRLPLAAPGVLNG